MKIIKQSHEIISLPENLLETLEKAGRICYKSEDKITHESAPKFIETLIKQGHHAMIEFGDIIIRFVTNRGVTHELVRHRLCSFAQESTRYVKYDGEMEFIKPVWCSDNILRNWSDPCFSNYPELTITEEIFIEDLLGTEVNYQGLLRNGWRPEQAREVLPNSLKTEIVVKANIREWRHIFSLRCSKAAHPQMRTLMLPLIKELKEKLPIVFDDVLKNKEMTEKSSNQLLFEDAQNSGGVQDLKKSSLFK